MHQPTNEELREVARKLAISHAKRNDEGHLDLALFFSRKMEMNSGDVLPSIGLVEIISQLEFPENDPNYGETFEFDKTQAQVGDSGKKFLHATEIIPLSAEQWKMIQDGIKVLPAGWNIEEGIEVYRAIANKRGDCRISRRGK